TARGHWILQFPSFPDAATRAELVRRGGRILEYVPDAALMVSFSAPPDLAGLHVIWAGQLNAQDPLGARLDRARAFLVVSHRDVSATGAAELLGDFQRLDGSRLLPNHYLVAANHRALPNLAAHDEVAFVMPAEIEAGRLRRTYVCAGPVTEAGPIG